MAGKILSEEDEEKEEEEGYDGKDYWRRGKIGTMSAVVSEVIGGAQAVAAVLRLKRGCGVHLDGGVSSRRDTTC